MAGIDVLGVRGDIARAPQSVTIRLTEDIDVSRGDLIAAGPAPEPTQDVVATVAHLNERPLRVGDRVLLKHTTRTVPAIVKDIPYAIAVDTLEQIANPGSLDVNDLGCVVLRTAAPVALDEYRGNRRTGSFLLIDREGGTTLTAGMAGQAF